MKRLLQTTTLLEAPTGLALIILPGFVVRLLLDTGISGVAIPLGRMAGVAVLALGVSCWLASYDVTSCAARGVVSAMVIYNLGAVWILGAAGIQSPPAGILLWPVVILHAAMAFWCVASLVRKAAPPIHSCQS
jgi:hypothetical protein